MPPLNDGASKLELFPLLDALQWNFKNQCLTGFPKNPIIIVKTSSPNTPLERKGKRELLKETHEGYKGWRRRKYRKRRGEERRTGRPRRKKREEEKRRGRKRRAKKKNRKRNCRKRVLGIKKIKEESFRQHQLAGNCRKRVLGISMERISKGRLLPSLPIVENQRTANVFMF